MKLVQWYSDEKAFRAIGNKARYPAGGWSKVHFRHPTRDDVTLCGKTIPKGMSDDANGLKVECGLCKRRKANV